MYHLIVNTLNVHKVILFFAVQNSIIISYVYINYIGVSRYAAALNVLHAVLILIAASGLSKLIRFKPAFKKIIGFVAIFIFQILNILLLSSFALGIIFLGMPFEYEMVITHLAAPFEFIQNYGINYSGILLFVLFLYIVGTSYYLSKSKNIFGRFKYESAFSNSYNLIGLVLFLLTLFLLPLSLSREPYLLSLFGHGFDGAPRDIYNRLPQPKINLINLKEIENIKYRPIILITVDAARADIFNPKSPEIKFLFDLNEKNMIKKYEDSYSICPVTYCGMLGTLGSTYWHSLSANGPQLQDYLASIGYRVKFLFSGDHSRYHGLKTMFGNNISRYYDGVNAKGNTNDDDNVIKWLESSEINNRTFLYIHLMSMHAGGVLKDRETLIGSKNYSNIKTDENYFFKRRYQVAARQADNYIETIFSILQKKGILDDAIIIISADHGEMLGEKGMIGHSASSFPHEQMIHIPLIIYDQQSKYPNNTIASQIDIAPTLVYAINGIIPTQWNGIPLQLNTARCAIRSDTNSYQAFIGFINGIKYKYVKYRNAEFAYNLKNDPNEILPVDSVKEIENTRLLLYKCLNVLK